jgi:Xaa-Pro aminopeptidase
MKYLIFSLFLVCMISGCKNAPDSTGNKTLIPDISDLDVSENLMKIYTGRRQNLTEKTGNGIVVLRSDYGYDGGRHEFRAANNFYYLTGFVQQGSLLVLATHSSYPYRLYFGEKSIREAIYTGEVPEVDVTMNAFKPDTIISAKESVKYIEEIIRTGTPVYTDFTDLPLKDNLLKTVKKLNKSDKIISDVAPLINEMRVHKDDNEISRIRKAVDITGEAFINACHICRPGMYEFEIEAMIEYNYLKYGSPMPAFESIVASGPNAVTLHYSANDRKMETGDLLLLDFGAEYGYYCADITRTIPVNGKFTEEQKDIYELVLKAQKAAIEEMIPGNHLVTGHNKSTEIIVRGLYELGLITDPESKWQKRFYILYPISHYLGMDVHDVGDYGVSDSLYRQNFTDGTALGRLLEKGMILTVEPGLYFRRNGLSQLFELFGKEITQEEIRTFIDKVTPVYEKYKNIGIRIEDDVLITDSGNIVLSKNIPKEIDEIERIWFNKKPN